MHNQFDQAVAEVDAKLAKLPPQAVAVFFSCCAERLAPFYEHFTSVCRWGDSVRFRNILDLLWQSFGRRTLADTVGLEWLELIDGIIPHADDFSGLEATLAQDACICLDLAIRWAAGIERDRTTAAVEYAFEARLVIICVRETGYLSLGSGPEEDEFLNRVADDPLMAAEFERQNDDIAMLTSERDIGELAEMLRARAWANRANPIDIPAA